MGFSDVVAIHPRYGYKYLDPMPTESELVDFYGKDYYDFSKHTNRAPDVRRLASKSAKAEIDWLAKTTWSDVCHMIDTYLGPFQRTVLDFGCGTGHLAKFLVEHGYNVAGIDLSRRARKSTRGQVDIPVYKGIKELKDSHPDLRFNAVILLNVLEHVANPEALLYKIKSVISYDGLIIARVPNDFSLLQAAARQALDIDPWWISYPDHISYFGFKSLASLLVDSGFRILNEMGDFPMEFFLLFGDDYISDPSLGKKCHTKRRNFELAIPTEIRQEMYRDFAKRGMGRNCLITAQLAE